MHSAIGIAKSGDSTRVIITGRNRERGEEAAKKIQEASGNSNIELVTGDISSKASVAALASKILKATEKDGLDVLVNNAGYLGDAMKKNEDGLEMHFAVNVRSPYQLAMELLPALKKGTKPRVINVTGGNETPEAIDADNLQAEKGFRGLLTYGHSKSALEGMTMALSKKLEADGIMVNTVFPGQASTSMTGSLSWDSLPGIMKLFYPLFKLMFRDDGGKSAQAASKSTVFAATSEDLDGVTGKFYNSKAIEKELDKTAYDTDVQSRILQVIESVD